MKLLITGLLLLGSFSTFGAEKTLSCSASINEYEGDGLDKRIGKYNYKSLNYEFNTKKDRIHDTIQADKDTEAKIFIGEALYELSIVYKGNTIAYTRVNNSADEGELHTRVYLEDSNIWTNINCIMQ